MYEANKAFQMFSLTFSGKNRRERAIADAADEGFLQVVTTCLFQHSWFRGSNDWRILSAYFSSTRVFRSE